MRDGGVGSSVGEVNIENIDFDSNVLVCFTRKWDLDLFISKTGKGFL